jgi:iron complex outermembrane recepter protein
MKRKLYYVLITFIIGLVFSLSGVSTLLAQETKAEEFTLEEITVTAAKRTENQQKVAIGMETISADQIKETGMNNLDQILNNVSNVIINKSQDGVRITIRGLADTGSAQHGMAVTMPTVAVNMDGVYSNRKDTSSGLFDLERVEVLYGPQSTLYASNSPGGIVNVVSANPKLDKYEFSGLMEYGNYNLLHTEGAMNAPISEKVALRAAFTTSIRDGYLSNGGDNEDSKSARLKLLYQFSDKLSFVLTGEESKSSTQRSGGVTSFYNGYYQGTPAVKVTDYWYTADVLPAPSTDINKKVTGRVEADLGFSTLSLLPSYSKRSGHMEERMEMAGEITLNKGDTSAIEKSIELRMASSSDFFFKWIAGFNYYKATNVQNSLGFDGSGNAKMSTIAATGDATIYQIGDVVQEFRNMDSVETAKAIFANITYPVTDTFRVTAGYRYSWDSVIMHNNETRGIRGGPDAGLLEFTPETFNDPYADPDYKVGVEYDLGANSMVYADYSTSYRVQAMGGGGPGTSSSQKKVPEKLKAYSAGTKNRFLDNKLQVNGSAFYYSYTGFKAGDMQTGWFGGEQNLDNPAYWTNAYTQNDPNSSQTGNGRMIGADVQTNLILSADDMLNLSVSYLKSEWTDLTFDYYYDYLITGVSGPPGSGYTRANIVPADTVSYNGKPMTMSPPWTISGSYSHNFNLPNGSYIKAQIDERYKTGYRMSWKDSDYPYNYQEACHITNLSAAYTNADGKWTLSAYVRNLENYAEKRAYMTPGGGAGITTLGSPRTYGGVLSVKF